MRDKYGKTFVLIDGYTLAIAQSNSGVLFSGRHSRKAITRYDDSLLIQFLARHAHHDTFWQCFQAREMYENEDNRFFARDCQQLIRDRSWKLPQMSVDWRGREDELVTLGTDPSLPKAEFFLNCLASHLARLWQNGDREATPGEYRAALKKGLFPLQSYFPKETYFLYCRGQMLLSGELRFHYGEWFDGGFLRLFRAEQGK